MYSGRLEGSQLIGNGLDIGERTKCQQREESSTPINRQKDLELSAKLRDIWERKYPADTNHPSPPSPDLKIWWDKAGDQQNTGHHSKNNHGIINTTVIQRLLG
jgi:hypothetical protein